MIVKQNSGFVRNRMAVSVYETREIRGVWVAMAAGARIDVRASGQPLLFGGDGSEWY
jgi:hypothetical protein